MTPEEFQERKQNLSEALFESDVETYYAVHSDGHHQGWKGLTQLLNDKINDYMDVIRERMDNTTDEIDSAKLRGRIDGLRDALQLITESNQ
jgi:hypothetical protein